MTEEETPAPEPRAAEPEREPLIPVVQPKAKKRKKKVSREPPRGRGRGQRR